VNVPRTPYLCRFITSFTAPPVCAAASARDLDAEDMPAAMDKATRELSHEQTPSTASGRMYSRARLSQPTGEDRLEGDSRAYAGRKADREV
jgi:hypothetical protein